MIKKCLSCGREVKDDINSCPLCGEPLTVISSDTTNTENVDTQSSENAANEKAVQPVNTVIDNNVSSATTEIPNAADKKSKSKLLIIIGVVLVLAVAGYFVITGLINKNKEKKEEKAQQDNKALALSNQPPVMVGWWNRCGFVDVNGNVVIDMNEGRYGDLTDFYGEIAVADKNEYNEEKKKSENHWIFINRKGEEVLDVVQEKYYFNGIDAWVINGVLYDQSLNKLSPDNLKITDYDDNPFSFKFETDDNKIGLINNKGKILYEAEKDTEIGSYITLYRQQFRDIDGYAIVKNGNEFNVVNANTGKLIKTYVKGDELSYVDSSNSNVFKICKEGEDYYDYTNYQILVLNDEIVYETDKYTHNDSGNYISYEYSKGYYVIKNNQKYKYYSLCDNKFYDEQPDTCSITESTSYARIYDYSDYDIKDGKVVKGDKVIIDDEKYTSYAHFPTTVYKILENVGKEYIVGLDKSSHGYVLDLKTGKEVYDLGYYGVFGSTSSLFIKNNNKESVPEMPGITAPKQTCYINLLSDQEFCFGEDDSPKFGANYYYLSDDNNEKEYYNSFGDKFYDTKEHKKEN